MMKSRKPVVAFALEEKAKENLLRKLHYLHLIVHESKDGNRPHPRELPTSLRRFNAWEHQVDDISQSFHRNANETLTRYPAIRDAALAILRIVKSATKPVTRPRDIGLKRAREQVKLHLAIRQIAEAELLQARSEISDLRRAIDGLEAQNRSIIDETIKIRKEFEETLQKLREQNSALLKQRPRNVRPIR